MASKSILTVTPFFLISDGCHNFATMGVTTWQLAVCDQCFIPAVVKFHSCKVSRVVIHDQQTIFMVHVYLVYEKDLHLILPIDNW